MSTTEVAAIIVAVASVAGVMALLVVLSSVTKTLTAVRASLDQLRRETTPLLESLEETTHRANEDLARVDNLLETAESISVTVDSASRLAYLTFSNPVIKALAAGAGTARAYRRFRGGASDR